jgi:hypothetical protein
MRALNSNNVQIASTGYSDIRLAAVETTAKSW